MSTQTNNQAEYIDECAKLLLSEFTGYTTRYAKEIMVAAIARLDHHAAYCPPPDCTAQTPEQRALVESVISKAAQLLPALSDELFSRHGLSVQGQQSEVKQAEFQA